MTDKPRMEREAKTVEVMIRRYCVNNHGAGKELCPDCSALLAYARKRLQQCPFQEGKTTCGNCKVHCYKPAMREKIRHIMRQVGPRMLFTNPIMGIRHIFDGLRKNPLTKD
ncbi:MAG TPA: nitrous oxide-stimulated promoter family protein [Desulfobulbaceae bacterium]|nr:nitrous oxide-stimulated promoter family protein [Desulfobulbaceae bacterium]